MTSEKRTTYIHSSGRISARTWEQKHTSRISGKGPGFYSCLFADLGAAGELSGEVYGPFKTEDAALKYAREQAITHHA